MEKRLRFRDYLFVGSMLFGLFFWRRQFDFPCAFGTRGR